MDDYYNEGRFHYKIGNFNQALINFKKALDQDPESLKCLYALGKTYAFRFDSDENYKESLSYFNRILQVDPKHLKAMIGKSFSLMSLGRTSETLSFLDDCLKYSDNGYLWAVKGRLLAFIHEDDDKVINCFKKAFELSEDKSYLHYLVAKAYEYDLGYEKASKSFNLSIEGLDDTVCDLDDGIYLTRLLVLLEKGWMCIRSGDSELAFECFDEVLKIDRKSIAALYSKSVVYYNLGFKDKNYWEDALNVLKLSLYLDPDDILSLILKAVIFYRQGSPQTAMNINQRVLEIDGRNGLAWGNLIPIFYDMEKYDEALDAAKKAIDIDPVNGDALYDGSFAARKTGNIHLARQWRRNLSDPRVKFIYLEKNLQDKLVKNPWHIKKSGYNLKFIDKEYKLQDGTGILDLLYQDVKTDNFVVVELKRYQANKKTYEQIKRYMNSISKTIGSEKDVKGIVISLGYDESFKNLIDNDPDIIQIDFRKMGLE